MVFPLGRREQGPDDKLKHKVASLLMEPSQTRDRLSAGMYINFHEEDVLGRLESALLKVLAADPARKHLKAKGYVFQPGTGDYEQWTEQLVSEGVISEAEATTLVQARRAALRAIAVDHFPHHSTLRSGRTEEEAA